MRINSIDDSSAKQLRNLISFQPRHRVPVEPTETGENYLSGNRSDRLRQMRNNNVTYTMCIRCLKAAIHWQTLVAQIIVKFIERFSSTRCEMRRKIIGELSVVRAIEATSSVIQVVMM